MIPDRLSQTLNRVATSLRRTPSKCLRRRYKKNGCRQCQQACPSQAIAFDGRDVVIDGDRCTECMLCAAVCPTEAIEPKHHDFFQILDELAPLPRPVLACRRQAGLQGNAASLCAGFYSHEHLLALALLLPAAVQLNLTACGGCSSAGMLAALKERHRALEALVPAYRGRIELVERGEALRFAPRSIGRRELFAFLGRSARQETARFLQQVEADGATANFAAKRLPRRRRLLNTICQTRPETAPLLRPFFFHALRAAATCHRCLACVAMCPTGALQRGAGRTLLFQSQLCAGCGLCVEFCPRSSLRLHSGCDGDPAAPSVLAADPAAPHPSPED